MPRPPRAASPPAEPPLPLPRLSLPVEPLRSANDPAPAAGHRDGPSFDLNTLVGEVAGDWMTRATAGGPRCHLRLALARRLPPVEGDPVPLAFALSGWLSLLARDADGEAVTILRLSTRAAGNRALVLVHGDAMPRLSVLRGILGAARPADPLAAHCAALVRAAGGAVDLVSAGSAIGIATALPVAPRGSVLPLASRPNRMPLAVLRAA